MDVMPHTRLEAFSDGIIPVIICSVD